MIPPCALTLRSQLLEICLTGGLSYRCSYVALLHHTFLNVAAAAPFNQVFPVHHPTLMEVFCLISRFGGDPTCSSRAMLNGAGFLSALTDFSIVLLSVILPNTNQFTFDFEIFFCARTHASESRATTVGAAANECGDCERSESG
jgi:hypothetical protein